MPPTRWRLHSPMMTIILSVLFLVLAVVILAPSAALAEVGPGVNQSSSMNDLLWTAFAGALSPLVGYVVNYLGPWVTEPAKLVIQTILSVISGVIVQLASSGEVGFNQVTAKYILVALISTAVAHGWWKAGGVNKALGAGSNTQHNPAR